MTGNPYAPPVAAVDEIAEEAGTLRPTQVVWAVRLLWASTVLSIPEFYFEAMRAPSAGHMIVGLVFELALTAFACYLYVCINRGRNWARIVTLVFAVLSTAMALFALNVPSLSTYDRIFTAINTVSDIVCMCLLFAPASSAWFRNRTGPVL